MRRNVTTSLVYHAKHGGDIEGPNFKGSSIYFASSPKVAKVYAEHCWYNDVWCFQEKALGQFESAVLTAGIVVFPVHLSLENPAVLGRAKLRKIGKMLGIAAADLSRFANNFEDSNPDERNAVIDWVRQQGHDGAILPKDMMPKCAGGDWHLVKSYVAFHPERQVKFAISDFNAEN
jgi:hypothetical protein